MQFDLRLAKKGSPSGDHEILLFFIGGRNIRLSAGTNIFIKPNFWNDAVYELKPNGKHKTLKTPAGIKQHYTTRPQREKLKNLETTIETRFYETPKEEINSKWLEKVIHDFHFPPKKKEEKKEKQLTFYEVLDLFVKKQGAATEKPVIKTTRKRPKAFKEATVRKFDTLKKQLQGFDKSLTFESLNFDKLNSFVEYLIDELNLGNSSVEKRFIYFRWFLNWATEWGYNSNTAYIQFQPNLERVENDVVYLDEDELKTVRTHDFSKNPRLDRVRDVFVFCCYSGLRYSDVENLKRSNIRNDKIYITTIKTSDHLEINLNDVTRSILEKYKDCDIPDNKALPVISNQKMNDALEDMAKACEINTPIERISFQGTKRISKTVPKYELVRTHTARRTFICTAIRLGISPTIIMKFTGHKDYDTMKKYIGAMDKEKADAMKLFND